ncbi:tRNA1Val (adenine37-N6)-methyltransferase [Pseudidiomarina indica]|uniref:tRNA1(Val) (adenine(37)-N6)-methyltransferase n=1 Tax=Pseudidiomarina indica TaxID=1159017 RepID=A0A1G6CVW8_9GAMM|nr:methyltransferase [Pseudidiomarina indica]SDB36835.1 tRNA1Val (adenine37-N6)-methyltransferase [Pseudidiomarina indica]
MGFQCRRFYLKDDQCAMKVSTDSLLFGAWVSMGGAERLLDLGTGCGILALMLAQRSAAKVQIDAVELDTAAAQQAVENVLASPWPDKVQVHLGPVETIELPVACYDLIVMNPPYFAGHLVSASAPRQLARQGTGDVWQTWLARANEWLCANGRIALVAPISAELQILSQLEILQLHLKRRCNVRSTPQKPAYLMLLELQTEPVEAVMEELVIRDLQGIYTPAFKSLTQDFYLS